MFFFFFNSSPRQNKIRHTRSVRIHFVSQKKKRSRDSSGRNDVPLVIISIVARDCNIGRSPWDFTRLVFHALKSWVLHAMFSFSRRDGSFRESASRLRQDDVSLCHWEEIIKHKEKKKRNKNALVFRFHKTFPRACIFRVRLSHVFDIVFTNHFSYSWINIHQSRLYAFIK